MPSADWLTNLEGRQARCICDKKIPSVVAANDRAFFEYRGPGSSYSTDGCKHCGYSKVAHFNEASHMQGRRTVVEQGYCPGYEQSTEGREFDSFYCGCRGWD